MLKIDFKLQSNDLLKDIRFDLPLDEVAEEVKKSVEEDLRKPQSFDRSTLRPLSPDYAARKRKDLGHSRIFDAYSKGKDKLINSVMILKVNAFERWVYIDDRVFRKKSGKGKKSYVRTSNEQVMKNLQASGRKGFGVTETTIDKIIDLVQRKIKVN